MGMFDVFRGWVRKRAHKGDATKAAQAVLTHYHVGRNRGATRVDDRLLMDLEQLMPKAVAQRIFSEFRQRRSREHPQAESILFQAIVTAQLDGEHYSRTAQPIPASGGGGAGAAGVGGAHAARAGGGQNIGGSRVRR